MKFAFFNNLTGVNLLSFFKILYTLNVYKGSIYELKINSNSNLVLPNSLGNNLIVLINLFFFGS